MSGQFGHSPDHGFDVLVRHEGTHVEEGLVRSRPGIAGSVAVLRCVAHNPDGPFGEAVFRDQRLGGVADRGHDVGPVQEHPLRPVGLVVQAPQQPDGSRQESRRGRVLVVDQVVKGQDQAVFPAKRPHRLHRAHHDVGAELVDLGSHKKFCGGERAVDQRVGDVRQQGKLPGVADEHRDVRNPGRGRDQAGAVPADAVVVVQAGEAGIDNDFHAGWSFRKRLMKPAAGSGVS